ncbi:MAG: 50S ribosomal protein L3 [Deltaproteobacteria bacterium]|nr:MAG: 50S ribosomal protein L3 [Deltaproteobacteria bacterium]
MSGILGKKLGMTQLIDDETGDMIPVTVVEAGPCPVLQVKEEGKERYNAIQLGFDDKPEKRTTKPLAGHFAKAGVPPKRFVREIRLSSKEEAAAYQVGQEIKVDIFSKGEKIDVIGTSKGRGFAGVMKRHNFAGFRASHGTHEYFRHGGSIGSSATPGKVRKGLKMAGHMGNQRVTVHNLEVVRVDPERNTIFLKGAVPGHKNGYVILRKGKKVRIRRDRDTG